MWSCFVLNQTPKYKSTWYLISQKQKWMKIRIKHQNEASYSWFWRPDASEAIQALRPSLICAGLVWSEHPCFSWSRNSCQIVTKLGRKLFLSQQRALYKSNKGLTCCMIHWPTQNYICYNTGGHKPSWANSLTSISSSSVAMQVFSFSGFLNFSSRSRVRSRFRHCWVRNMCCRGDRKRNVKPQTTAGL